MSLSDQPLVPKPEDLVCKNCMFYRKSEALSNALPGDLEIGRCYLRPPTYVGGTGTLYNPLLWAFPGVKETDFCGEYVLL